MLSEITPVILAFNEAPNIARTLAALSWASDIVLVDSNSTDGTIDIARRHSNVRFFTRTFDAHANQWNFAISQTAIRNEWILALDADYVLTDALMKELQTLAPPEAIAGYYTPFQYCVFGKPLRGSVYPPVITLFRRGSATYEQDGHTQRLALLGRSGRLAHPIRHDDRKSLSRWFASQSRYSELEAKKLTSTPARLLAIPDRIRKAVVVAPALVFFYTLFAKGVVLDGRAGLYYALQRTMAELLLSLYLLHAYIEKEESVRQ